MDTLLLTAKPHAFGEVVLPGSKSLSNRALLLASLAQGNSVVSNLLDSDDVRWMLKALASLGVKYQLSADKTTASIQGNGGLFKVTGEYDLYLGNAGTAFRPLIAALAFNQGQAKFLIHGEPRMHERPIEDLVEVLQFLGCDIKYLQNPGYAPVEITTHGQGLNLTASEVEIAGNMSSQFLTALLMVSPLLGQELKIKIKGELVSKPYIRITLHCMKQFGVEVEVLGDYEQFCVKPALYQGCNFLVEGDASSASYFMLAGAIAGKVVIKGLDQNSIQGDMKFLDVLSAMGAEVSYGQHQVTVTQNPALSKETGSPLQAVDLDLNHIPDAAMGIAIAALFTPAGSTTTIRNIYTWRLKETDRLAAMATELRKVGALVEEGEDYIKVTSPEQLTFAQIGTYNDHRMAMCFSLVALNSQGVAVEILDPACVNKTFPTYFQEFAKIRGE